MRTVFSVDARNHGDSPRTKIMSYATMAKDIENFIKQIEAPKISFLGKSNFSNSYEMWTVWSEGLFGCLSSFYLCLFYSVQF